MILYALTVPHVFAINLPSSAAWKSQHNSPPFSNTHTLHLSVPHTYIQTTTTLLYSILLSLLNYFDTFNPLFLTLFISHSSDYIPTHTCILSVRPTPSLGTGANTLEGLQSLAQLQLAAVLNGT